MNKQETTALNMAKFICAQSQLLLDELDPDDAAADCEKLHEQAEALHQKLNERLAP